MKNINEFRQGDLLFRRVSEIPELEKSKDGVVAEGEGRNHLHRVIGGDVFVAAEQSFVRSDGSATIAHTNGMSETRAEHHPIPIPAGDWIVIREKDYDPFKKIMKTVID